VSVIPTSAEAIGVDPSNGDLYITETRFAVSK